MSDKSKKLPVSAVILAGGRGERIGGNKLFLSWDGIFLVEPLIKKMSLIFDETLLCVGHGESGAVLDTFHALFQLYSVNLVEDRSSGRGPIEGLYMGLDAMSGEWGFLTGCDMPNPQEAVIRYMWDRTAKDEGYKVFAARFDGYIMPFHAFYHKDCSCHINSLIERVESESGGVSQAESRGAFRRELRVKSFYSRTKVNVIEEDELSAIPGWRRSFSGYNTDEEFKSLFTFYGGLQNKS